MIMLPGLIRKAIGDAGFDLLLGSAGEWERVGISGSEATAWVLPVRSGALLALSDVRLLRELAGTDWTDVPLPPGAIRAVRCQTPGELFDALKRVRILMAQLPPVPAQRFAAALDAIDSTERTALVKQRVGQDLFREMLLEYWEGKCPVTGLAMPQLLRASHAKPWAKANDDERLDVFNGLLLAVHFDALFDAGFMTFDEQGIALFSPQLPSEARALFQGDNTTLRLTRITAGHQPYMKYHRESVFKIE